MRGRWQMYWKAWTASWLCVTGERSSPARRRHPAQAYSEASTTLLHTGTPPRLDLNGLSRRWEAALAALDAQMDARYRQRRRQSPQGTCHAAQEAHSTPDGKVERCSEGEAQGVVVRGVARELGIHRDTAKKYMEVLSPPMKRDRVE